jgi:hypothetical protein
MLSQRPTADNKAKSNGKKEKERLGRRNKFLQGHDSTGIRFRRSSGLYVPGLGSEVEQS